MKKIYVWSDYWAPASIKNFLAIVKLVLFLIFFCLPVSYAGGLSNLDRQIGVELNQKICGNESHSIVVTSTTTNKQKKRITGRITDNSNEPIIGANVVEKGSSNNGTITDVDGNFSLDIQEGAFLHISYIGYLEKDILIDQRNTYDIVLSEDVKSLDELVVIGYGSVKKSDLTGSVQKLDASIFKSQSMSQVTDMLTGTVAGFNTVQSSSPEGGASMEIRGRTSLNASNTPMIILDGAIFNGNLVDINPQDVESVEILKDASSSAIFGSRAANGIVLITTQKGKKGKPVISFSSQLGVSTTTNDFKPYDKSGYLTYRRDLMRQLNPSYPSYYYDDPRNLPAGVTLDQWRKASGNPQNDNVKEWLGRLNFYGIEVDNYVNGNIVDWFNESIKSGSRQKYDLSISGATDNVSYYWSIDHQKNKGVIRGEDHSVIRTRLNLDFKIVSWLNAGFNAHYAETDKSSVPVSWQVHMYYMSPYGSMYEEDGSLKWYPNTFAIPNPLLSHLGQKRWKKVNTLFASAYMNIKLPLGINYKISYQPNYQFSGEYNFFPSTIPGGEAGGVGSRSETRVFSWIFDHLFTWKRQFGVHSFDATFLYSAEQTNGWTTSAINKLFIPNQKLGFSGLQFGTNPSVNSWDSKTTADALMGRINYSLLNRYLLTASIRRDGYSAFGVNNPRATFPAVAFAWKLSEEDFFNLPNVYQLKLRTSWGQNGNREIGAYAALAQLKSILHYNGSSTQVGVYNSTLPNDDLKWEKTEAFNIGVDLGLFDNRVDLTADFYVMNTFDLLMERMLPEITGFEKVMTNLGQIRNKGMEFTLNTVNIDRKNFRWTSSLVYSANRNKIIKLFGDYQKIEIDGKTIEREVPDYTNKWFPGHAIDHIWDYEIAGVWQTNEKDEAAKYRLEPGDWKAVDQDKNEKYEAIQDKRFIGYSEPRYRIGLRNSFEFLKNFSLSFFLRADLGHLAPFDYALQSGTSDTGDKRNKADIPYWTKENPINDYPRLNTRTNVFGGNLMIYKPRSFVRLQDFTFSYSIPNTLLQPVGIRNMDVYYSGHNLFYISKWPGWDPESLNSPMYRTHTFGLRLTL